MRFIIILNCLLVFSIYSSEKVCRNTKGQPVDWYAIFFMPRSVSSDNLIYYAYFDNTLSSLEYYLYEESSFPPTMITAYVTNNANNDNFNYFFWNDDQGTKESGSKNASSDRAHSKGSLVYDRDNGAFLSHSLPRFPTRTDNNELLTELPSNAGYYGQHFFCISITKDKAEKIVELLNYINVSNNYSVKKDNVNSIANEWVTKLINNVYNTSYPLEMQTTIKSLNGNNFNFISKSYLNKIIPYDTTLRSIYLDDFYVRTWVLPALAPTICEEYSIYNVENIQFGKYGYAKGKEHSKWAISFFKKVNCFADLNHCPTQQNRGGHIICFENEALHNIMKDAVQSIEPCIE